MRLFNEVVAQCFGSMQSVYCGSNYFLHLLVGNNYIFVMQQEPK